MSPVNLTKKYLLDTIVDDVMLPVRLSLRNDYPRCSFTCGITNLTLLIVDERSGVAFVLILVAISKPGSDMLYKTSQRIENAWKRGQTVNVKVDDFGNTITNDDDEDGSEDEDVIAESRNFR